MLLELIRELGLIPIKTSNTKGGEYHSPCPDPGCGGKDRFVIWPEIGRYWCRQCKKSGNAICFCRDFMGLNYRDACKKVGNVNTDFRSADTSANRLRLHALPNKSWVDKAQQFVEACHKRLLVDPAALHHIKDRGLSESLTKKYVIGWNPITSFPNRMEWGLPKKIENGLEKKLFIPSGLVIPTFQDTRLVKIKIRRKDWVESDPFGKYYVLPGSVDIMPTFGDLGMSIVVVVEAEFDAMLIAQEVGDSCCTLALGGAQKRPDEKMHQWLSQKKLIILSLDDDEAGQKEYLYWASRSNLRAWPVPYCKSPGDAFKAGLNIRDWILAGIRRFI